MYKIIFTFLLLLLGLNSFAQENSEKSNFEKEVTETIDWINSKFIKHQFATSDTKQIQSFENVKVISGIHFLTGSHTQETDKPWRFKRFFFIPIEKINSISFSEKSQNIWLEIRIKNNEPLILITRGNDEWQNEENIAFILSKTIDDENLRPRLQKAFKYLMKLYGNEETEKF